MSCKGSQGSGRKAEDSGVSWLLFSRGEAEDGGLGFPVLGPLSFQEFSCAEPSLAQSEEALEA